ncbi:MAG: hypothetical protein ABSE75_01930 [Acidimicrobiales bacterium]|jgi:hypothetical protein
MKTRSTKKFTTKMTQLGCAVGALALLATVGVAGTSSAASTHSSKSQAHAVLVGHVAKTKKVAFHGSYSGSMTFLLTSVASTSTAASVTSVSGKGTSTDIGTTTLTGTGNVPATAASSGFHFTGSGKLAGAGGTLTLRILSKNSTGAAPENAAGSVSISGTATVVSGTGKLKGATGTLKFSGAFAISNDGVSGSQTQSFTSKLSGTLVIK